MLREGRDSLVCDLAETYHVLPMEAYPVHLIATLATGLGEGSRIRKQMEGRKLSNEDSLLALIFDKVNWLCWANTKDAQHGENVPKSMYSILTETDKEEKVASFTTPEEFEKRRQELLGE